MEWSYYNVVVPASYGGLIKFRQKGYIMKETKDLLQTQDVYTLHINQRDDDFPDVKWSCME